MADAVIRHAHQPHYYITAFWNRCNCFPKGLKSYYKKTLLTDVNIPEIILVTECNSREFQLLCVDHLHINIGVVLKVIEGALDHLGGEEDRSPQYTGQP